MLFIQDLLIRIDKKLDAIGAKLEKYFSIGTKGDSSSDHSDEDKFIVCAIEMELYSSFMFLFILMQWNDINLLNIHAKDAYAYSRALLDVLFTKKEQKESILFQTA